MTIPMRVSDVGEFALIARLQQRLQRAEGPWLVRGIGDDCAVLRPAAGMDLLITTDAQEESIHFRRDWSSPQDIGWRCLAVNVSDIAAMGGRPLGAVIALSLPPTLDVAFLEALYDGVQEQATAFACPIIGGNMSRTTAALTITITVLGEVPTGQALSRAGAQVGDEIWVTGSLGGARAGLEVLLHPEALGGRQPAEVLARYRRPHPRLREAEFLRQHGGLHSLIDLSDGISSDLGHICAASGVGAHLHAASLPLTAAVRDVAHALGVDPLQWALHGGEDFELCGTAPPGVLEALQQTFEARFHVPLVRVGTIHAAPGMTLIRADGTHEPLRARGYDHFRAPTPEVTETPDAC